MAIISVAYARIAFQLWGGKPPGEAQEDRDHNILANKKKVSTYLQVIPLVILPTSYSIPELVCAPKKYTGQQCH